MGHVANHVAIAWVHMCVLELQDNKDSDQQMKGNHISVANNSVHPLVDIELCLA